MYLYSHYVTLLPMTQAYFSAGKIVPYLVGKYNLYSWCSNFWMSYHLSKCENQYSRGSCSVKLLFQKTSQENTAIRERLGVPGGPSGKEPACQSRRCKAYGFDPWIRNIPLEEGMATHSSVLAWRIPGTKEPLGLQSIGSQGVGDD